MGDEAHPTARGRATDRPGSSSSAARSCRLGRAAKTWVTVSVGRSCRHGSRSFTSLGFQREPVLVGQEGIPTALFVVNPRAGGIGHARGTAHESFGLGASVTDSDPRGTDPRTHLCVVPRFQMASNHGELATPGSESDARNLADRSLSRRRLAPRGQSHFVPDHRPPLCIGTLNPR